MQNFTKHLKRISHLLPINRDAFLFVLLGAAGMLLAYSIISFQEASSVLDDRDLITTREQDMSILLAGRSLERVSLGGKGHVVGYFRGDDFVVVHANNLDTQLPAASLIKMITASAVLASIPLDTATTILPADNTVTSREYLSPYTTVTARDLLQSILVTSSNSSVATLGRLSAEHSIDLLGSARDIIEAWNLNQTTIGSLSGLDQLGSISYMSPRESVLIAHHLLRDAPWLAEATTHAHMSLVAGPHTIELSNSNPFTGQYPNLRFSKTGYTDLAGGNLVTLIESCGLVWGTSVMGDTFSGRFTTTETFLDTIQDSCSDAQAMTAYLRNNRVQ